MTLSAAHNSVVVLAVEDESVIRMVLVESLLDAGFDVIEANHAQDAISILEADAARVHALFTDVHMPGEMDGVALAHHTRRQWPWISLLVTSGRAYPRKTEMPDGARFISKPYNLGLVARHLREMTGGPKLRHL